MRALTSGRSRKSGFATTASRILRCLTTIRGLDGIIGFNCQKFVSLNDAVATTVMMVVNSRPMR